MSWLLIPCAAFSLLAVPPQDDHWPSFRGNAASGTSEGHATPLRWNVETGENVKWTREVPGLGLSSPVIWGSRIFITTAVRKTGKAPLKTGLYGSIKSVEDNESHLFLLLCFNRETGEKLWSRTAHRGPTENWSTVCWIRRATASAGRGTGSTWFTTESPTATTKTRPAEMPGPIATM